MFALAFRTFVVALLVAADAETCVDGQCPASPRTAGGVFMQMQTKPKRALVDSKDDGPHILHQCPATQAGESFGNVQTSQVDECSGLAASRVNRGVYWESGYGLTREGKHVARLRIENSRANDWEDVAIGPGPEAGKSYIYVGDVGDNRRQRGTVQIYRVEEPTIPNGRDRNDDIVVRAERFDVTYPDGMKYDCEALFIDQGLGAEKHGTVGRLYLITKGDGRNNDPQWRGGDVFYVDLPARGSRLNFVETSDFATGADITSQGNVIAIRSYGNVLMWPRPCQWTIEDRFWDCVYFLAANSTFTFGPLMSQSVDFCFLGLWASMSRDPCYVDKKNERQGEAIAFGKDGDHYITISEGKYQPEMMSSVALLDISGPGPKGALVPIEPRIANVCPATGGAEWKGKVWESRINECSGLAASRLKDDVYWINNDSGDGPMLYAINLRGDHLARIKVVNVEWANDWEDTADALHPKWGLGCPEQGSYIYVADTGDNYRNRWSVQIYRFKEPPIPDNRGRNDDIEVSADKFDIKYPGGAYDCEAMFVDQRSNGRVYVITKGDNRNSEPRWRGGDLFYIDLPARPASDLTFQETGLRIPACYVNKADERQGEAIAFGKNGDHYITVSEGRNPPVWYFSLPGRYQQALATSIATEPRVLRLLAIASGALSAAIVVGQLTMFREDWSMSLLAHFFDGSVGFMGTQVTATIALAYMVCTAYWSVFRLKIAGWYGLYGNHNTDAGSLLWCASLMARLSAPLCHLIQAKGTSFQAMMGQMNVVPVLGKSFNEDFPVLIVVLVLCNLLNVYSKIVQSCGLESLEFDGSMAPDSSEVSAEGRRLVERERRKRSEDPDRCLQLELNERHDESRYVPLRVQIARLIEEGTLPQD
eukprot:s409_g7.t1